MSNEQSQEEKLTGEFRILGKNLADVARAAWNNPERQRLQSEIEKGLSEMRESLIKEYEHFRASPTAKKVRDDVENLGNVMLNNETEMKIRSELISALKDVNKELENLATQMSASSEDKAPTDEKVEPDATRWDSSTNQMVDDSPGVNETAEETKKEEAP